MTGTEPARRRVDRRNYFEDFEVGQTFQHHWGRTINHGDNSTFTALMMHATPSYFNADYARDHGHEDTVVNHFLAFNVVFGMSVQDLSEAGGAFLGIDDLTFHRDVYPGDTLYANSEVVRTRESESRPHQGIVTWHTEGVTADGEPVLEYERTNLIAKRDHVED